jgi:hypothetical protein
MANSRQFIFLAHIRAQLDNDHLVIHLDLPFIDLVLVIEVHKR